MPPRPPPASASFGRAGGTDSFDDVEQADCLLVVGANPVEAHPVVGARLLQRALDGAVLVVADPRGVGLARHADVHLPNRPGTNVALFHGLAHVLVDEGLTDPGFLRDRAAGLDELTPLLAEYPPARVAAITGVPARDIVAAARYYGRAEHPAIVYGLGVTEHLHGTDGVRALANLPILRGAVGATGRGFGITPCADRTTSRERPTWVRCPICFPATAMSPIPPHAPVPKRSGAAPSPRHRGCGSRRCSTRPATAGCAPCGSSVRTSAPPTRTAPGSPKRSTPAPGRRRRALRRETARHADVVLPVASWLEKDGTFVNFDRRFQRVRTAVGPPGGARTDFAVVHAVAAAMGADLGCRTLPPRSPSAGAWPPTSPGSRTNASTAKGHCTGPAPRPTPPEKPLCTPGRSPHPTGAPISRPLPICPRARNRTPTTRCCSSPDAAGPTTTPAA
ncbi:molybdopterin-dependent oxidoreductase [Streptomyces zhihengii]